MTTVPAEQSIFHPARGFYRVLILIAVSLIPFGSYFAYDIIGSIANSLIKDLQISQEAVGTLYTMYSIAAVLALLVAGFLIDRLGTRKSSLIFICLVVAGSLMIGFTRSKTLFYLGRFVFGAGAEPLVVAQLAMMTRWFKGRNLALAYGISLAVSRLGSILSFNSGELISQHFGSYRYALYAAIMLCGLSFLSNLFYVYLDRRAERLVAFGKESGGDKIVFKDIFSFKSSFWYITLLCLTFYAAVFPFTSLSTNFFVEKWNIKKSVEPDGSLYVTNLARGDAVRLGRAAIKAPRFLFQGPDTLLTIAGDGTLRSLNAADGAALVKDRNVRWANAVAGAVLAGRLYTIDAKGMLQAFDLQDNSSRQIGGGFAEPLFLFAASDRLVVISSDGSLTSVNPEDGSRKTVIEAASWSNRLLAGFRQAMQGGDFRRPRLDETIAAAVLRDRLYTVENDGDLLAIDPATGACRRLGKPEFGDALMLFAAADKLCSVDSYGNLRAINPADGSWAPASGERHWTKTIAGVGSDGSLYFLKSTGSFWFHLIHNYLHIFNTAGGITSVIILISMLFAPWAGKLIDRIGKRPQLMIAGSLLIIPSHLLMGLTNIYPVYPMILLGIAFVLVPAALWPSVSLLTPKEKVGTAFGLMTMIQNMGLAAFPPLNGALRVLTGNYTASEMMFAAMCVLGLVFAIFLRRADRKEGGVLEKP